MKNIIYFSKVSGISTKLKRQECVKEFYPKCSFNRHIKTQFSTQKKPE